MDSANIRKRNDVLLEIVKASDAIRRKHKMIKLKKDVNERVMDEMFKPLVTPLQELVDTSKQQQQQLQDVKRETKTEPTDMTTKAEQSDYENAMENLGDTADDDDDDDDDDDEDGGDEGNDGDDTIVERDITATSTPIRKKTGDLVSRYLKMFGSKKQKDLDTTWGVRNLQRGMVIGDARINFADDLIYVGNTSYAKTPGLLELVFKKIPDPSIVGDEDVKNYIKIVTTTNVCRKNYTPEGSPRDGQTSAKYRNWIAPHIDSPVKRKQSGEGLPAYKIARKEGQRMDYVYWDDPNGIIDRLRLLMASQAAGNSSHSNEIISIIEELREAGIVY